MSWRHCYISLHFFSVLLVVFLHFSSVARDSCFPWVSLRIPILWLFSHPPVVHPFPFVISRNKISPSFSHTSGDDNFFCIINGQVSERLSRSRLAQLTCRHSASNGPRLSPGQCELRRRRMSQRTPTAWRNGAETATTIALSRERSSRFVGFFVGRCIPS